MRHRVVGLLTILATTGLAIGATALSGGTAQAATLKVRNHLLVGAPFELSCPTASRCIAVGSAVTGTGSITPIVNGRPGHRHFVSASPDGITAISCPSNAGCWAVGVGRAGHVQMIKLSSSGKVLAIEHETLPVSAWLLSLSCVSMTDCGVAGQRERGGPAAMVIGSWNGSKLTLHVIPSRPRWVYSPSQISCFRSYCMVVGDAFFHGSVTRAFVVTTSHGKLGRLDRSGTLDSVDGVDCVSTSTCYADGDLSGATGFIATLTSGVVSDLVSTGAHVMSGIACRASFCVATATNEPPLSGPVTGVLYPVSSGKISGPKSVLRSVSGYYPQAVATCGTGFMAVGAAQLPDETNSVLSVISG
jgi:hypothetical protein